MTQWYRKSLGLGAATYQDLRALRQCRLEHDHGSAPASIFVVALEIDSESLCLFLPPGNESFAEIYGAVPCGAPDFSGKSLKRLSEEYHPLYAPKRTSLGNGVVREDPPSSD